MNVSKPPPEDQERRAAERQAAERRRRRAAVFGDVLPETTADDRDAETGSDPDAGCGESAADAWLRRNVPPHHGTT